VPGRGDTAFDVTILKIDLAVPAGANCLSLDFRFLSEEFPEFRNQKFNDAFITELDNSSWTTSGSTIAAPDNFAFDPSGAVITVSNPGGIGVNLTSISDVLPAGFTYTTGSTSGVTTSDPAVSAQTLTWSGPFTVPAAGSVSLHFTVTVSAIAGTYLNNASADAGSVPVTPTGPTAGVTVVPPTTTTTTTTSSTTTTSTSTTTITTTSITTSTLGTTTTTSTTSTTTSTTTTTSTSTTSTTVLVTTTTTSTSSTSTSSSTTSTS